MYIYAEHARHWTWRLAFRVGGHGSSWGVGEYVGSRMRSKGLGFRV